MPFFSKKTALLVIDVQQGFDDPKWGPRNNPEAEANIARLIAQWRSSGRPIIFIQHASASIDSPLHPSKPTAAIKEMVAPMGDEPVFTKRVHSAFIGTPLEAYMRAQTIDGVVIVGLTTDHCVSTTTRMASDLGFNTAIVSDATATFDREGPGKIIYPAAQVHELALVNLHDEFATVLDTEAVISYCHLDKKTRPFHSCDDGMLGVKPAAGRERTLSL